jgi:hypothetical protein
MNPKNKQYLSKTVGLPKQLSIANPRTNNISEIAAVFQF